MIDKRRGGLGRHNAELSCRPSDLPIRDFWPRRAGSSHLATGGAKRKDGDARACPVLFEPSIDLPGGLLERDVKPRLCRPSQHHCHGEPTYLYPPPQHVAMTPVPECRLSHATPSCQQLTRAGSCWASRPSHSTHLVLPCPVLVQVRAPPRQARSRARAA